MKSSFTENHDVHVYNILISSCLIVAFSRLELGDNIVTFYDNTSNQAVEICYIVAYVQYITLQECTT